MGISSDLSAIKIGETTLITFSLSEPTSDFTSADVIVTGGTLSNFAQNELSYIATFTPTIGSTTTASINVAAGKFADAFGNQNLASNALKISVDTSAPLQILPGSHRQETLVLVHWILPSLNLLTALMFLT